MNKQNKKEKNPLENIGEYGLELGINKLEQELKEKFDVDKSIALRELREEAIRRGYTITELPARYIISKRV
jgi:hypothetical protein